MAINNQDKTEIHNLPEVTTLQPGMMVAVDSEPTGTKSFNLTTALEGKASADDISALENELAEKIDAPATTPTEGQVLTFNGSANTWANPPAGVYVLNYSEITDIRDVDIEKAKTLPTFLKIDTEQPLTISVPKFSGSPYMVTVQPGTIMGLEEIGSNDTSGTYSGPKFLIFGSKFGEEVGGGIMQKADLRVICCIALSAFGGVSKGLTVTGNLDPSGNLFGNIDVGTQPFPITTTFFAGKGPGDPNTNRTKNALGVEFQSAGKIRRQVLMPEDIQSNLFYSNSTPEIIQFMGWGSTSNRAGYRTSLLATHSTRSSEYPPQTPAVAFNRYVMGSSETSDNVATSVNVEMISSVSGQGSAMFGGNLVPPLGTVGALQYWSDNNGSHYGWKPVHEVPSSTASDSGKVLSVDSNGTACWGNAVGFVKNAGALTDAATITASNLNNGFATLSTSQSALTIIDVVGTDEIVNFAIEITPSVNCTLTIQKQIGSGTPVTLKHAVSAGNELEAGKTYQVTAVGTCWTLAEFEA